MSQYCRAVDSSLVEAVMGLDGDSVAGLVFFCVGMVSFEDVTISKGFYFPST